MQRDQQPRNLRHLREAIVSACESLDQEMIQNAFDGMISRHMSPEHKGAFRLKDTLFLMSKLILVNHFVHKRIILGRIKTINKLN